MKVIIRKMALIYLLLVCSSVFGHETVVTASTNSCICKLDRYSHKDCVITASDRIMWIESQKNLEYSKSGAGDGTILYADYHVTAKACALSSDIYVSKVHYFSDAKHVLLEYESTGK